MDWLGVTGKGQHVSSWMDINHRAILAVAQDSPDPLTKASHGLLEKLAELVHGSLCGGLGDHDSDGQPSG